MGSVSVEQYRKEVIEACPSAVAPSEKLRDHLLEHIPPIRLVYETLVTAPCLYILARKFKLPKIAVSVAKIEIVLPNCGYTR